MDSCDCAGHVVLVRCGDGARDWPLGHGFLRVPGERTWSPCPPHALGCPTFPGQAWGEGWATGLSCLARGDSKYFDKQGGSFFWLDVAVQQYSSGQPWQAPSAQGGLLQVMDENAVSAMLWNLAIDPFDAANLANANGVMFNALKSTRMKQPPFARGYTKHTWAGFACQNPQVTTTEVSVPMIADYLDAVRCGGYSAANVQNAIGDYPYPVNTPICK